MRVRDEHRRRRRTAVAGARQVPAPGDRRARVHAAGHRGVRRRHAVPATPDGRTRPHRSACDADRGGGSADPARLAGRPNRRHPARRDRPSGRTRHAAGVHRPRRRPWRRSGRPGTVRAEALRHPEADRAGGRRTGAGRVAPVLHRQPVVADHRLQGHADRRPGDHHVPGSGGTGLRVGAGARPLAVQHQHVPIMAAGAPVSLHCAQW